MIEPLYDWSIDLKLTLFFLLNIHFWKFGGVLRASFIAILRQPRDIRHKSIPAIIVGNKQQLKFDNHKLLVNTNVEDVIQCGHTTWHFRYGTYEFCFRLRYVFLIYFLKRSQFWRNKSQRMCNCTSKYLKSHVVWPHCIIYSKRIFWSVLWYLSRNIPHHQIWYNLLSSDKT